MMLDNGLTSKPSSNLAVHTKFISSSERLHCQPGLRSYGKKRHHIQTLEVCHMRRKLMWLALSIAAIGVVAFYHAESARATTASGFTGYPCNLNPVSTSQHFGNFRFSITSPKTSFNSLLPHYPAIPGYPFKRPRARQTCTCRAIPGSLVGAPAGTGILATA